MYNEPVNEIAIIITVSRIITVIREWDRARQDINRFNFITIEKGEFAMQKARRLAAVLMAAVLTLSLAACSGNGNATEANTAAATTEAATEAPAGTESAEGIHDTPGT